MGNQNARKGNVKRVGSFLKKRRNKSKISKLDAKNTILIRQANKLVGLRKKLYPHPDITSAMSSKEKKLNRMIAKKFSDANENNRIRRNYR